MNKRTKYLVVFLCLIMLFFVVGCKNEKSSKQTASSISTTRSASKQTEVEIENGTDTMNFSQIKNGNYSSLLGDWYEVAVSTDKMNEGERNWQTGSNSQLSISETQFSSGSMTLQGNKLNDGEEKISTFRVEDKYLVVTAKKDWTIYFCPSEINLPAIGDNLPDTIRLDKDRIVIQSGEAIQVFQRDEPALDSAVFEEEIIVEPLIMDLNEIKVGNYESLSGIWVNNMGQKITITNELMSFSDVSGQNEPAQLIGLHLDIPTLNDSNGLPKQINYMGSENLVATYEQLVTVEENTGFLSFRSALPSALIYISFLPQGIQGEIQNGGDSTQDRIVAIGTQNDPTAVMNEYVYYKLG